jgi:hypothetical protein
MALKITGEPRGPGHVPGVALLRLPRAEEQREVAVLHFLRRQTGRHGQAEMMHHPLVEALGTIGALRFQKRDIISYSILGHLIPQKWVFLD